MSYFNKLKNRDTAVFNAIANEVKRQAYTLELIASENFTSLAVLQAMGSVMTNKYSEGYPFKRYYGGCQNMDAVEQLAIDRAKLLFGAEHANVQPHSGAQANMGVYLAMMKPGDCMMGMELSHGGHLTHGHPINFTGRYFKVVSYRVNKDTELIDFDLLKSLAEEHKPKVIVCGYSAYSRIIDFNRFAEIAHSVGAVLMADIAHIAGMVAVGLHPTPVPIADFVTTTTHKTLRGPRGGMVMCKSQFAADLDKAVFPGVQGGPLMHVIAAKAVCLLEALKPEFKEYQAQILKNAQALAKALMDNGLRLVSGGTDNHLMLVDLRAFNLTGKVAEAVLEEVNITVNKNTIPYDPQKPFVTSGIRIGTPALTTRGMKEPQMSLIGNLIAEVLKNHENVQVKEHVKGQVKKLCDEFPLYPELLEEISR